MTDGRGIVVFDGVCNLCHASVDFIIKRDPAAHFQFVAAQTPAGQALMASANATAVASPSRQREGQGVGGTTTSRCFPPARHQGSPCSLWREASASAVILVEGNRWYAGSTAALHIARRLVWPWRLLYALVLVPRPVRDAVYHWVGRNRYRWFGRSDVCRVPTAEQRARFLETGPLEHPR